MLAFRRGGGSGKVTDGCFVTAIHSHLFISNEISQDYSASSEMRCSIAFTPQFFFLPFMAIYVGLRGIEYENWTARVSK